IPRNHDPIRIAPDRTYPCDGCDLRNGLPLLDTRIPGLVMVVLRFLFLVVIGFISAGAAQAENVAPSSVASKSKTPAPAEPQITFNWIRVDGPYIAMTFDDGPNAKLTPKLLDLLAAHHIKATFFVLGECVAENSDVLRRAAREGHEIGNNTWSHPNLGKMSDKS